MQRSVSWRVIPTVGIRAGENDPGASPRVQPEARAVRDLLMPVIRRPKFSRKVESMHKASVGGAPDPAGHAQALVDAYGRDTALLLASAHAAGQAPGTYWFRLLMALTAPSPAAAQPLLNENVRPGQIPNRRE